MHPVAGVGPAGVAAAPQPGPLPWPCSNPHVAAAVAAGWLPGPSAGGWVPGPPPPVTWPPTPPAWPHVQVGPWPAATVDEAALADLVLAELDFSPLQRAQELADEAEAGGVPTDGRSQLEPEAGSCGGRTAGGVGGTSGCPCAAARGC